MRKLLLALALVATGTLAQAAEVYIIGAPDEVKNHSSMKVACAMASSELRQTLRNKCEIIGGQALSFHVKLGFGILPNSSSACTAIGTVSCQIDL